MLLRFGLTSQNQDGPDLQRFQFGQIIRSRGGGQPVSIFGKQHPNCLQMIGFFGFQIQIQSD